jgi:hypothetical protein
MEMGKKKLVMWGGFDRSSAATPFSPGGNTPPPTTVINRMREQRPVTPSPRRLSTPRRQTYGGTPKSGSDLTDLED